MSEAYSGLTPAETHRLGGSRALVIAGMLLFSVVYTGLTLYGSWDFLLNEPGVIRLNSTTRAPIIAGEVGPFSSVRSLPDDWRNAEYVSKIWRYRLVFEIVNLPLFEQEVYLPYIADNAQITINGVPQPYFGRLGNKPDFHWSVPLMFPVDASNFRLGLNELFVDVYSNEADMGSLSSVAVGPRGAFEAHRSMVYASKRGLAYVLLAVDVFAICAFALFAVTVSGRFYLVGAALCVSLLGCLFPHLLNSPIVTISELFTFVIISFLLMMNCMMYMCSLLFEISKKVRKRIYSVNALNIVLHLLVVIFIEGFDNQKQYLIYLSVLVQVTGISCTWILIRRFILHGELSTAMVLFFAFVMTALGIRDLLVLWHFLPSYNGFYTLHAVALLAICLMIIVALRIRDGSHEQIRFDNAMQIALADTRQAIDQSRNKATDNSVDALVSRIATTYSHEFRNPLAAALATTKTMSYQTWGKNGHTSLGRIDRSIGEISDALNQQFDFYRAMQSTESISEEPQHAALSNFSRDFPSCKIVWLSDPNDLPNEISNKIQEWISPYLIEFGRVPSVCLVRWQNGEVVLHLYLYLNASDLVFGTSLGQSSLEHLNPQRLRDFGDGQYLYWRYALT